MKRLAGVDIGTNTILMSIADKHEDGTISLISDFHEIARLGEGVNHSGIINPNAVQRAVAILRNFSGHCHRNQVSEIRAAGTSALRDARNNREVLAELSEALGSKVKVITGGDEARLSFLGASTGSAGALVIDIGGGSTEFISGTRGQPDWLRSYQVGSVRLTEMFFTEHPPRPEALTEARGYLDSLFKDSAPKDKSLTFGIGGTFTAIAGISQNMTEFESNSINGLEMGIKDFEYVLERLMSSSIEQIINQFKIHPGRADIVTAGTLIAISALSSIRSGNCIISTNGLRTGLIYCADEAWHAVESIIDNLG